MKKIKILEVLMYDEDWYEKFCKIQLLDADDRVLVIRMFEVEFEKFLPRVLKTPQIEMVNLKVEYVSYNSIVIENGIKVLRGMYSRGLKRTYPQSNITSGYIQDTEIVDVINENKKIQKITGELHFELSPSTIECVGIVTKIESAFNFYCYVEGMGVVNVDAESENILVGDKVKFCGELLADNEKGYIEVNGD